MTRPLNQLQLAEHGADEINTLLKGERHYYRPVAEPTQLAVLETFLDAVYAHKKVIVDYRKRDGSIDKDYVFTPLSIEHFDYYWYVRGYKEVDTTKGAKGDEADAARILRCDGVLSIKIGPDATKRELEGFEADRNTVIGMFKAKTTRPKPSWSRPTTRPPKSRSTALTPRWLATTSTKPSSRPLL